MTLQYSRHTWFKVLSKAAPKSLEAVWRQTGDTRPFQQLRAPETGLAMVRGRADGTGQAFNLGETTITRCVLTASDSASGAQLMGVGYVVGRDKRHAELIARFDAVFQDSAMNDDERDRILAPLVKERRDSVRAANAKTAATKVDFFTMVRGE
jgi:alpha-D-ribose 1-methylphosphonate 5-triphosphate synthase subunit PhnG